TPIVGLEVELAAELEQPPPHDLNGLQPLVSVPGRHVQNGARVEEVVDVHIPAQSQLPHPEGPAETKVHLPESILEQRVRREEVDRDVGGTRAAPAALAEIAPERGQNLCIAVRPARGEGNPRNILVDRAGLELPWQRVAEQEFDLRR